MNKKIVFLVIFSLILLVLIPMMGIVPIRFRSLFAQNQDFFIFWQLRVPRVLLGFISGAILGLSGLICQNLFKNQLATPDILGITTGAGAGAVIALKYKLSFSFLGLSGVNLSGFLGALGAILVILAVARVLKNYSIYALLMSGIALNLFFSAVIVFFQYLFDFSNTYSILRWLMGGLSVIGYGEVVAVFVFFLLFTGFTFLFRKELMLISVGDEFALSKGLNVRKFRIGMLLLLSVVVGMTVSVTGPIGFVALVIPHVARIVGRKNFSETIFSSLLLGGIVLASADFVARMIIPPVEIPVGIITSILGAPFFLIILISDLKNNR